MIDREQVSAETVTGGITPSNTLQHGMIGNRIKSRRFEMITEKKGGHRKHNQGTQSDKK